MSAFVSQAEVDALLAMDKHRIDEERLDLPDVGGGVIVPLLSADGAEHFHLDISRSRMNLAKGKFQNRARTTMVLARVDIGGAPHRNPDGEEIGCPHIHLYREGYGDRWAFAVPPDKFTDPSDHWQTLNDFMRFCNITRPPLFNRGLFS
ncbi:DUF6978 family protein [Bosea sp. NPDC003192]|uniref:DUF6978 family protein n=1 Tax=Bosea sp. NPDC003192 TaxID=3390551 RepID=UPI003D075027